MKVEHHEEQHLESPENFLNRRKGVVKNPFISLFPNKVDRNGKRGSPHPGEHKLPFRTKPPKSTRQGAHPVMNMKPLDNIVPQSRRPRALEEQMPMGFLILITENTTRIC
jgi:hypothetical protein